MRRKTINDFAGSLDANDRYFGRLYPGMLSSEAYKSLSLGARHFYCLCRAQASSAQSRRCLFNHGAEYGRTYPDGCFTFPASHIAQYGVNRRNAQKYFKELEQSGFIEVVEKNNRQRLPNIYRFSGAWKGKTEDKSRKGG